MTTIEERAARLRERRRHWHCGCRRRHGYETFCTWWPGRYLCTDDHNPETALDAAALLFDLVTDPDVKAAARRAYDLLNGGKTDG